MRLTLLAVLLLASCATPTTRPAQVDAQGARQESYRQRQNALKIQLDSEARVYSIARPLLVAAAAFCEKDIGHDLGLTLRSRHSFPEEMQEAAFGILQMGDHVRIGEVSPDSPAGQVGIQPGDLLWSINGWLVPLVRDLPQVQDRLKVAMQEGQPVRLGVVREGQKLVYHLQPQQICNYALRAHISDGVNAFADGKTISITRGMLNFAATDSELALVIAHEIAHNAMGHQDAKSSNRMLGSILDIVARAYGVPTHGALGNIAARAFSQDFEVEADYISLYILARSGRDLGDAAAFWRKMAAAFPDSILNSMPSTHPSTAHRLLALEAAVKEIEAKRKEGHPLLPEMK